ncbi:MAG: FixH family protein [Gemmatimonadaceae bacterium]
MRLLRKDRVWPTIIVLVLSGYVVFGIAAARLASSDPNFAIEPDYYRKAVTWDSTLAQDRANVRLGWRVTPLLAEIGPSGAELSLVLSDSGGAPVRGASMRVEARQVAHADDVLQVALEPREAGVYAARVPMTRTGLWELRVDARRGAEHLTANIRMDASRTADGVVIAERPGDALPARLGAGAGGATP